MTTTRVLLTGFILATASFAAACFGGDDDDDSPTATATQTDRVAGAQTTAAPAATQQPAATATPQRPAEYTVVDGDTLSEIAARFGLTLDALVAANGIEDANTLAVGQVLKIPAP